ncbi:cysteine desulfurase family protein [Dyella sp. A6]|uniref:cysteine desulfurase family protein n=1 Tax=Dyella aluminiiresistens TaxID=3069105 RepID=UPI002E7701E6|nr:cysteine desulfurase family protein [Dyella sp. A6]
MSANRPIYLDSNATTPVDARVLKAMLPWFSDAFGNPSSVEHAYGAEAASAIERARDQVATAISARSGEVIFTGSCTEADNLAIVGAVRAAGGIRHVVSTAIEHPAVLESLRQLEREGHRITIVGVDESGTVRLDELEAAIRDDAFLVSVMGANNEVGTIQPLAEVARLCQASGTLFHSDLAQLPAYARISVDDLGLDLASFSGHKVYGPKGVGALYTRRRRPRITLSALTWGGGQEKGLRSGTINTPLVVAFGEAMAIAARDWQADSSRIGALRNAMRDHLLLEVPGVSVNGHPEHRLANNLSLSIDGIEPLALMRLLRETLAFSASSACSTESFVTSHVLLAMWGDGQRSRQAFRLSPGRLTTEEDIQVASAALVGGIETLRRL